MSSKNFEENRINDYEKQKLLEKSNSFGNKKNFSKTLAASLAILNLFSGSFTKAAKDGAKDKNVNAKSKKEFRWQKIIEKKNQMFDNFKDEWLTKKNAAFATVTACALAFACKAEKDNRKLTESNQELLKTNEELSIDNVYIWLLNFGANSAKIRHKKKTAPVEARDFLVKGLKIALSIREHLLNKISFKKNRKYDTN